MDPTENSLLGFLQGKSLFDQLPHRKRSRSRSQKFKETEAREKYSPNNNGNQMTNSRTGSPVNYKSFTPSLKGSSLNDRQYRFNNNNHYEYPIAESGNSRTSNNRTWRHDSR